MATQKVAYAGVVAETLTGTSLGSNASREGTLIVNTSNDYIDAIVSGKVTVGAAAALGPVFLWFSSSDATNISYPATGSDAAITIPIFALGGLTIGQKIPGTELVFFTALQLAGVAATTAFPFANLSIAQAFNNNIPPQWAVGITNCQGQAFDATAGHTVINYNGITFTIA